MKFILVMCLLLLQLPLVAQTWIESGKRAINYYQNGDYPAAIQLGKTALEKCEKEYGIENSNCLNTLYNLGVSYKANGEYNKAISVYQKVLEISDKAGRKENADYLEYKNSYALLHSSLGNYEEALLIMQETIKDASITLGKDHWRYGVYHSNYAAIAIANGEYKKALAIADTALEILKKTVSKDNSYYFKALNNMGLCLTELGQYKDALPYYLEALECAEQSIGRAHPDFATSLSNLGSLYKNLGLFKDALHLFKQALELSEKTIGKAHPDYAIFLNNVASVYSSLGQFQKSILCYKEALEVRKNSFGNEHPAYATSLSNLANVLGNLGRYNEAISLHRAALTITETSVGQQHPDFAIRLNGLAMALNKLDQNEEALELQKEAVKLTKSTLGTEHSSYAGRVSRLASIYVSIDNYLEAIRLYHCALETTARVLGKNHPDYAVELNNLATAYNHLNKHEDALPLFTQALEILDKTVGTAHPHYAQTLSSLSQVMIEMNDYEKAFEYSQRSLNLNKTTLGVKHPNYAQTLNNHGSLFIAVGRYSEALRCYESALEIIKINFSKKHSFYTAVLGNIAGIYEETGRETEAIELYEEVLKIRETVAGKNNLGYATALNNLAGMLPEEESNRAENYYKEAINITEKILGGDNIEVALYLNNLAYLYFEQGEFVKSLPLNLRSVEITDKKLGTLHPDYTSRISNLAFTYEALGEPNRALPLFVSVYENIKDQLERIFMFSTESEKSTFLEEIVGINFEKIESFNYSINAQNPSLCEVVYNSQLLRKNLLLHSSINIRRLSRSSKDSTVNEKYNQWLKIKRSLAKAYLTPIAKSSENIANLEQKANLLESQLIKNTGINGEWDQRILTWKDIQQQLQGDEIAIEFASFKYFTTKWTDSTLYVAYIITPTCSYPQMVFLFEERQIIALLNNVDPQVLYSSRGIEIENINDTILRTECSSSHEMYKLILNPLKPYLKNVKTINYSPGGILHQISLAALTDSAGELFCNQYNLVQLSTTGHLAKHAVVPSLEPALLIGGINYEYTVKHEKNEEQRNKTFNPFEYNNYVINHSGGLKWNYLPGTAKEVNILKSIYDNYKLNATIISADLATEDYIKSLDGNSPSIIHFSTHGFYFEAPKIEKQKQNSKQPVYVLANDPLIRSGLVLAGANYAWEYGNNPYEKEDGILTAYEISNLDLSNTELVVLSACETGLGDIEGSEGVYGLQRAFKMAGVNHIIMSLWPVPDKETVEFMSLFYKKWLKGADIRRSFEEAQQQMSLKYKNQPQKWAAFVLVE